MAKNIREVELFLFDLDGTVYIGDNEIEGSFAAVNRLREMGKRICFFTNNSSRMHTDYIARLNNLGLRVYSDEIYTSGQVTCEYLLDNYRGKKFICSATTVCARNSRCTASSSSRTTPTLPS